MQSISYFRQLALRISLLLLLSSLIRISYYFYNIDYFTQPDINEWTLILLGGLRFDLESLIYVNALFIILSLMPIPFRDNKIYKNILKTIFILTNAIFVIVEIVDMTYFQYVFRRLNGSDLSILINSIDVVPGLLVQHFTSVLLFILIAVVLWFIYIKTEIVKKEKTNYFIGFIVFIIAIGLAIIGSRGGLQLRPLSPISATKYVKNKELTPLVSNGTIHLLFATEQSYLSKKNYFSRDKAYSIFNPEKKVKPQDKMDKKNIFIITLESFGKEYIKYFNKELDKSYTPFLDSLISEGLLFNNSYACGVRSPYGLAGIGASIPTLMEKPISFSAYQSNCIDGFGSLLNNVGYTTGFFHGGRPTSMNIDRLARLEGYSNIYTMTEFNDDSKFDGEWGIWDDHFFQYTLNEVHKYEQPFSVNLFSVTSHAPYDVEKWFKDKYPEDDKILRSVRYTDYSLRHLFEEAKKQSWYENTIFIIVSDHIGRAFDKKYTSKFTKYQIPILFFTKDSTFIGVEQKIVSQIDIMPTVLKYLNYPETFNAFGVDVLGTLSSNYFYTYSNGMYQIMDDNYISFFDGRKDCGLYDYIIDPNMTNNITDSLPVKTIELQSYLKSVIQIHNELMIDNKLCNYNFNKNK